VEIIVHKYDKARMSTDSAVIVHIDNICLKNNSILTAS
jgi:hypothetical protein